MQVKNLFILNETYPLPMDKYAEFKSRKDGCKGNPMCTNKLKYDAETFIVGFGKKHGKKIETGEESSFIFLKDGEGFQQRVQNKVTEAQTDKTQLAIMLLLIALVVYAVVKKDIMVGAGAVVGTLLYFSVETKTIA